MSHEAADEVALAAAQICQMMRVLKIDEGIGSAACLAVIGAGLALQKDPAARERMLKESHALLDSLTAAYVTAEQAASSRGDPANLKGDANV